MAYRGGVFSLRRAIAESKREAEAKALTDQQEKDKTKVSKYERYCICIQIDSTR